eukprot:2952338-Amphidinium_carterae.1
MPCSWFGCYIIGFVVIFVIPGLRCPATGMPGCPGRLVIVFFAPALVRLMVSQWHGRHWVSGTPCSCVCSWTATHGPATGAP